MMLLDENILRFTVVDDDGNEEYIYYDLNDKDERIVAVQTLINQIEMLESVSEAYVEELNHFYKLQREN